MKRVGSHLGFDVALALAMAAIALVEVFLASPGKYPYAVAVPTALALAAPLVWRRSRPVLALGLVLAVVVLQRLAYGELWDSGSLLAIPLIAVYSVAAYTALRVAVAGYLVNVVVLSVCDIGDGADYAFISLIYGAIWIAGRMAHRLRQLAETNAEYARQLEELQLIREEQAASEERARIARELHDVVAHCVSTMVVQAEAGQALLASDPDRAGDSFSAVQGSGRQALAELRRMLGVLREDPADDEATHQPQPSLDQLESLLDTMRRAGLVVDLEIRGERRVLSQGVDLTAYRIVQESLTNTLKHANATRVVVRLGYTDEALHIDVTDDGRGQADSTSAGGHGLLGMRERAHLHGSRIESGAAPGGGYAVRTKLPL